MADRSQKRSYVKMKIEDVRLVPDEAVLGGCKTADGGGIGQTGIGNSCELDGNCSTDATS
jgi:hypothetical protein